RNRTNSMKVITKNSQKDIQLSENQSLLITFEYRPANSKLMSQYYTNYVADDFKEFDWVLHSRMSINDNNGSSFIRKSLVYDVMTIDKGDHLIVQFSTDDKNESKYEDFLFKPSAGAITLNDKIGN